MSTQIVAATPPPPVPLSEMERMAQAIAKSGLFGLRTPEQALTMMLIAQAEGRHPALAARDYDIIQGKPAKKAEAMLRDFLASGGKVTWHDLTDEIADATFSHPSGGEVRITWDMKRAQNAGLAGKDNWKKHPRQMLRSRVVSEGIRTVCPAATSGMYPPEEVRDFEGDKAGSEKDSDHPHADDAAKKALKADTKAKEKKPEAQTLEAEYTEDDDLEVKIKIAQNFVKIYGAPKDPHKGKALKDIPLDALAKDLAYWDNRAKEQGITITGPLKEQLDNIRLLMSAGESVEDNIPF